MSKFLFNIIHVAGFVATLVVIMVMVPQSAGLLTREDIWERKEYFKSLYDKMKACRQDFYSLDAFNKAHKSYSQFGTSGKEDFNNREIAAAFAHFTHETRSFCDIEAIIFHGVSKDYCDENNTQYPCNPSKRYYGRGPIQLKWNYNYGAAGESNNFDGLNAPETVATDPVLSFKTALWFWMKNVRPVLDQGFGATIRAISGELECDGANQVAVNARVGHYTQYCSQLGVDPGLNLTC